MTVYFLAEREIMGGKTALTSAFKIGYTGADSAASRVASCQTGNPRKIVLFRELAGSFDDEQTLHGMFSFCRLQGEWFLLPQGAVHVLKWKRVRSVQDWIKALPNTAWHRDHGSSQRAGTTMEQRQEAVLRMQRAAEREASWPPEVMAMRAARVLLSIADDVGPETKAEAERTVNAYLDRELDEAAATKVVKYS